MRLGFRGVLIPLLFLGGCARFPEQPQVGGVRRFVVEFRVAGRIKPNYFYFALFNLSNDPTGQQGPVPVVAPPWGNGFAAGAFTHFMRYDPSQPQGGYGLYRVVPGTNLTVFEYLGRPLTFEAVREESQVLRFEFDLTQFEPDVEKARALRFIQVNLLATDRIPLDPNDHSPKFWDAWGDSRNPGEINSYLTFQIDQDRIFRNADRQLEPEGDVRDPDLDLVDWRIEVRALP